MLKIDLSNIELKRRHTASHIMTAAVRMIYKETSLGVGPWTEDGFYQDFDFGDVNVSDSNFKEFQKKIRWIINKNFSIVKEDITGENALNKYKNDPYKMELIQNILKKGEKLTFYNFVDDQDQIIFQDLCAGPHLESTGEVGIIKLTKIAGAYWRGDEKQKMLTRIYGVAFATEEELNEYEIFLEEVKKRDHRKLGQELDLFTFSEKVGAGLPLFTPKGTFLREKIATTIQTIQKKFGYKTVSIPHITKKDLYETSGHWDKFKEDLFHVRGKQDTEFVMKPMNCPHHTQIYASQMRSYKDLPIRYAEVTTCYRDELPGELLGLSRVRSLTQDDGHAFCRLDQIKNECKNIVHVIREFYTKLGMMNKDAFWVSLSVRDSENLDKYLGDSDNWDKSEQFLEEIAQEEKFKYSKEEGEAAFYGPKLDFQFKDAIGRKWQLATIQIDFVQPERFGLEYINEAGKKEIPVMIHRAVAGSLERFLSVIIEHFAGAFPLWLAPVQIVILPVGDVHIDFSKKLEEQIIEKEGRCEILIPSETLGKRLRKVQMQKVPITVIIGDKEIENNQVTIREYGEKKDKKIEIKELLAMLNE